MLDEAKIREMMGLGPDVDIMAAIKTIMEQATASKAAEAKLAEVQVAKDKAEAELSGIRKATEQAAVDADVTKAITDKKLLPKQKEWATALRAKDKVAFEQFLATAGTVGPDMTIKGGDLKIEGVLALTEAEIAIGKQLGNTPEQLLAAKEKAQKAGLL